MESSTNWTLNELCTVYTDYPKQGPLDVASKLGRTVSGVVEKAQCLGVEYNKKFTEEEIKLAQNYGATLGSALLFLLPKRSIPEIGELITCAKETCS